MDSSLQCFLYLQIPRIQNCFNPCFNGFFSSICEALVSLLLMCPVSILVLMDSSLQSLVEDLTMPSIFVSILVLMDSSLQFLILWKNVILIMCFNPCFNGFFSSMTAMNIPLIHGCRFNPCFNGFFSSIKRSWWVWGRSTMFQSLF